MPALLIRNALLIDGTGAPGRPGSILIEGGKVADLLPADASPGGARIVEARGMVACPGFIDIHSHGDLVFTLEPREQWDLMAGRIGQGITSEIVGNCGLGVFPCDHASGPIVRDVIGWMTPPSAAGWTSGGWEGMPGYLSRLEQTGTWVNVGALQPHGPLRIRAAGLQREIAGDDPMPRMIRDLEEALDSGAFGLSTGLIYPPGIYTPTDEIVELARVVSRRCGDRAFVASHIRGSSETLLPAVEELISVGRRAGVRVHHSHNEAVGRGHWHKIERVLEMEEEARRSSIPIRYDMFPYTAAATMMIAIYPPWALEGGVKQLLGRLADPGTRKAIEESIRTATPEWPPWTPGGWPHNLVKAVGWDLITIGSVSTEANRPVEGMSLAELGRARGRAPFEAISDLMLEEGGRVSQIIHGISGEEGHEAGIEMLLKDPAGAICTDANDFGKGKPHPAAYGTFARVLGKYVRQRAVLALEKAVHKMTGYPASLLGLSDRGTLRRGSHADVVVFDPETIGSRATYDDPRVAADGIAWVFVNGIPLVTPSGVAPPSGMLPTPGKVLRRA